jgi:hypothetical protein
MKALSTSTRAVFCAALFSLLLAGRASAAEVPPLSPANPGQGSSGVTEAVAVVDGYLGALRAKDWARAYDLLSWPSRQLFSSEEWAKSAESRSSAASSSACLTDGWQANAPLPGADSCQVSQITLTGNEGRALVEAAYSLPLQIHLVKEPAGWRIDLPSIDRDVVYSMSKAYAGYLTAGSSSGALPPNARSLLAPFVKSHRIEQVELEGHKAKVRVVETAVVSATLKLERRGPFWEIALAPALPAAEPAPAAAKKEKPAEPAELEALPAPRHWRK